MVARWSGFADLSFQENARLAFARAAELAETDAHELHPEAWVIEDQRILFNFGGAGAPLALLEGLKRFLSLLVLQSTSGEAVIETTSPLERWVRRAAPPSISKELSLTDLEDDGPESRTIRVAG